MKEVYIDITYHQPGAHVATNTLFLIGIICAAILAFTAICAVSSKR